MAQHDYKSRKRKSSGRPAAKSGTPGWAWLAVGLAIGLFAGFLFYLSKRPAAPHPAVFSLPAPAGQAGKPAAKSPPKPAVPSAPEKPKFDFYTMLPKLQVDVPKAPASLGRDQAPKAGSSAPASPTVAEKVTAPGRYILQIASFGTQGQADVMKAKLAFQGIMASVSPAKVKDYTWYRVQVGPYSDVGKLNAMIDQLAKQHIKPLVIKMNG